MNLDEIWEKARQLTEDVFPADAKGAQELKDFIDRDEKVDSVEVIDAEADDDGKLKDSYIGNVILDCCVCHSKIFRDRKKIKLDDTMSFADVGVECPYCYSDDGYKIVGVVGEFKPEEEKEGAEVKIEESAKKPIKEGVVDDDVIRDVVAKHFEYADTAFIDLVADALRDIDVDDEDDVDGAIDNALTYDEDIITVLTHYRHPELPDDVAEEFYDDVKDVARELAESQEFTEAVKAKKCGEDCKKEEREKKELKEAPMYDLVPVDGRSSFYGKAKVVKNDDSNDEQLYSYNTLVAEIKDGKPVVYGTYSMTTLRHIKAWLAGHGFKAENKEQIMRDYGEKELKEDLGDDVTKYQRWVDYDMSRYGKISRTTRDELEKAGLTTVEDKYGELEVIAKAPIEEDVQSVEVKADENKVVVEVEKKDEKEEVKPMSDEVKTEIAIKAAKENEEDHVDIDIDDFDEETFDELGESYLKQVYNNVDGYKTTAVNANGNSITLEGVITFTSGNKKNTQFVFEALDVTRSGKIRMRGENVQITPNRKAFMIKGSMDGKKFMTEALNYNYRVKGDKGCKRAYGTIRKRK